MSDKKWVKCFVPVCNAFAIGGEAYCGEHKGFDAVNHPKHYTSHPSGIECIQVVRHMEFNLGNAMKYIWRADLKKDAVEDMRKAIWYIQDEIDKREGRKKCPPEPQLELER